MITRLCQANDWPKLVALLNENDAPTPMLKNIMSLIVVEDKGEVIAFGYLEKLVEAVFVPSKSLSTRDKVESLKLVNDVAISEARQFGIDEVISFADPQFADILIKHFNYAPRKGEALTLDTTDGKK